MDMEMKLKHVFDFSQQQDDFALSTDFVNDIQNSQNPFIIAVIGNARVGKSERLNQILTRQLKQSVPFKSANGTEPVTSQFQYCGPIKFALLSRIHNINLDVPSNPDLFFVDCEGLHSFGKTTPGLKKATFALTQMARVTVLVMKDQVNYDNLTSVISIFTLTHAFSRAIPRSSTGTAIMIREVGVRVDDEFATISVKDQIRRQADIEQRRHVQAVLNEGNESGNGSGIGTGFVHFCDEDLLVLAQPERDIESDLYWKSIEDLLKFIKSISNRRSVIPGSVLTELSHFYKVLHQPIQLLIVWCLVLSYPLVCDVPRAARMS
jgi:hypothetical protein